jgi:hypothetical protein
VMEWYWKEKNWRARRGVHTSAILFVRNPTWIGPGSKTCPRSEKPANIRLNHARRLIIQTI